MSETDAVVPGRPLALGIRLQMQPGWHTYWRYPGDAGVPPRFDFAGSQNVKAVEVLWPAPQRIQEEGMVAIGLILNGNILSTIPAINSPLVPQTVTVSASGFSFSPSTITIRAGDTVNFAISSIHNAVEVSKAIWDVNGIASNGGFTLPFGGGSHTFTKPGIYYFVCTAHASFGMKGTIIVN